jgi:hypothetical protein
MANTSKILMVLSSASETYTGKQAGWYLPEAAHVCFPGSAPFTPEPNSSVHNSLAVLFIHPSWLPRRFRFAQRSLPPG